MVRGEVHIAKSLDMEKKRILYSAFDALKNRRTDVYVVLYEDLERGLKTSGTLPDEIDKALDKVYNESEQSRFFNSFYKQ